VDGIEAAELLHEGDDDDVDLAPRGRLNTASTSRQTAASKAS
jgi:hypothetical protein